jgi:hypothetical protein
LRQGFIGIKELGVIISSMPNCEYRTYLETVRDERARAAAS